MNGHTESPSGAGLRIVELRRYATRPAQRHVLIELFEREFIETQGACGMVPLGQYRDLDDDDSFVWLRGFPDMDARRPALQAFYSSPAWIEHRNAANATMIDSDNVLLLRNARPARGLDLRGLQRRPCGDETLSDEQSFVAVTIFALDAAADEAYLAAFERDVLGELRKHAQRVAYFVSEERPNDFPALPVRDGHYFVALGLCGGRPVLEAWKRTFADSDCEVLRLEPAARALFR